MLRPVAIGSLACRPFRMKIGHHSLSASSERILTTAREFRTAPRRTRAEHARRLLRSVEHLTDDELVHLESRIRSWADYWFPGWKPIDREDKFLMNRDPDVAAAARVLAAMGPNGFLRQEIVENADLSKALWLRLCLVRACDWVPQVRDAALRRVMSVDPAVLVRALPLVALLRRRDRAMPFRLMLDMPFNSKAGELALVYLALDGSALESRLAWVELIRRHPASAADHIEAAARHSDIRVRQFALAQLDRLPGISQRAVLASLTRDPVGSLRAEAISQSFELNPPEREDLTPHLEDRSHRVRALAQDWCRRMGLEPASIYRNAIAQHPTWAAVTGLGETGGSRDVPVLDQLCMSENQRVRDAALSGLTRFDKSRAWARAQNIIQDRSSRITRSVIAALLATGVARNATGDLILERIMVEDHPVARRALLHAVSWSPWHHLVAAALLESDPDPWTREAADEVLRRWPSRITELSRSPEGVAAREVQRLLPNLDPRLRSVVAFVLRTSNDGRN